MNQLTKIPRGEAVDTVRQAMRTLSVIDRKSNKAVISAINAMGFKAPATSVIARAKKNFRSPKIEKIQAINGKPNLKGVISRAALLATRDLLATGIDPNELRDCISILEK